MSEGIGRVVVVGSLDLDLQVEVARLPSPGETFSARPVSTGPGGKGLNQAVASAHGGIGGLSVVPGRRPGRPWSLWTKPATAAPW